MGFERPHIVVLGAGFAGLTFCQALRIRHNILLAFEQAENEPDRSVQDRLMTIVVVGGGPTGVELAGAFAELARHVLRKGSRNVDPGQARVVLLEAGPRILAHLPPSLSASAQRHWERLCVEARTGATVRDITSKRVELANGQVIEAGNIIWAAALPLTRLRGGSASNWLAWLFVHLIFLIGFDNKLGVMLQWTYSYCTYKRGARIIIDGARPRQLG